MASKVGSRKSITLYNLFIHLLSGSHDHFSDWKDCEYLCDVVFGQMGSTLI